jgi:hypothetical protein
MDCHCEETASALTVLAFLISAIVGVIFLSKLHTTDGKIDRLLETDEAIKKLHKRVDFITYALQKEYVCRT